MMMMMMMMMMTTLKMMIMVMIIIMMKHIIIKFDLKFSAHVCWWLTLWCVRAVAWCAVT
jgi:hypothetical protein